jgi:hypothetical protein
MTVVIAKYSKFHYHFDDFNQDQDTSLICICLIYTRLYFPVKQPASKIVISIIDDQIIGKLLAKSIWF